ncbi:MAG: chitobiase/beta-hexosaminidase C-terminal domain-containing protein [Victivallales bacterium]|nr:chitobiase/beta-hexosaminidase C-terminal domain-containing protein [Victivallales bacterium]
MKHFLPMFLLSAAVIAAPQIAPTTFPTCDVPIVDRVFTPPTPDQDASTALQAAIDELAKAGGGTIFIPAVHVRIESPIILKEGVVLRGDFMPQYDNNNRKLGTVFDIICGKNEPDGKPAFGVERGTGLREIAFWYPEQTPSSPVPYPWTIYATAKNCGNNFTLFNCVFLNPWKAIHIGPEWNELHTIRNTQIFPFETGIFMDYTTDIGRLDGVIIESPKSAAYQYPNLPNLANPNLDGIDSVGIDIGRSDWEYIRNINVSGMKIGVRFRKGQKGSTNAVMAFCSIMFCETALELNELDGIGVALYSCSLMGTRQAVLTTPLFETVAQFNRCKLRTLGGEAIVRANGSGILTFDACDFGKAPNNGIVADAGRLQFVNCDIDLQANPKNMSPFNIKLAEKVRLAHLLGGSLALWSKVENNATDIDFIQSDVDMAFLPPRIYNLQPVRTSDFRYFQSKNLVPVTDCGASPDLEDNGPAFQLALDAAAELGGATVYAPAGLYRFKTNITVPTGVELRGCFSVPHHTVSGGTVLMPLQGKGDENGTPFVSLQPKSGLNGLSFWYPEQSTAEPTPYPWTVRSLGADCWLVNTNIGNAWQGVDFLTHPSDNHYINYLSGGMIRRGLQVGNSMKGTVIDVQFNPHYTHRLPSYLPHTKLPDFFAFIDYQRANLDAIVVKDALNETMVGNFLYAARDGLAFKGKCTGEILMHGADTVWNPVALECDTVDNRVLLKDGELRFALAQLVPMGKEVVAGIVTRSPFKGKVTFANSQLWGGDAPTAKLLGSGTVILDQLNTLTGPIIVKGGECQLVATHFTNATLSPHISVGKGAQNVRSIAASTPANSIVADYPEGADVKMIASSQPMLPPIAKDAVVPNWRIDFENESNPPVIQDTVAQTGGGIRQFSDYSCRVVDRDDAHSGKHALRLQGKSDDASYSHVYFEIFRGPFTVMPDTIFRYWTKPLNEKGLNTGLDIHFTNGKVLRDMGIRSRVGTIQHIGNAKGKLGEWTEVVIDLGKTVACGWTIEKIMAAYDSRNGGERIDVLFDDIALESVMPLTAWLAAVTPASGTYPQGTKLSIDNTSGLTIRYTLDASNPTPSSAAYKEPISLPKGIYEFRYAFFDKNNEIIPFFFSRSYNIK